jgi:hypothetical protein
MYSVARIAGECAEDVQKVRGCLKIWARYKTEQLDPTSAYITGAIRQAIIVQRVRV